MKDTTSKRAREGDDAIDIQAGKKQKTKPAKNSLCRHSDCNKTFASSYQAIAHEKTLHIGCCDGCNGCFSSAVQNLLTALRKTLNAENINKRNKRVFLNEVNHRLHLFMLNPTAFSAASHRAPNSVPCNFFH